MNAQKAARLGIDLGIAPYLTRTTVADAAYTAKATDYLIAYTSLTAARTVTLPDCTRVQVGKWYEIVDESGNAAVSNITVAASGTQKISGASTKVISTAFGGLKVYSNGTNWFVRP